MEELEGEEGNTGRVAPVTSDSHQGRRGHVPVRRLVGPWGQDRESKGATGPRVASLAACEPPRTRRIGAWSPLCGRWKVLPAMEVKLFPGVAGVGKGNSLWERIFSFFTHKISTK